MVATFRFVSCYTRVLSWLFPTLPLPICLLVSFSIKTMTLHCTRGCNCFYEMVHQSTSTTVSVFSFSFSFFLLWTVLRLPFVHYELGLDCRLHEWIYACKFTVLHTPSPD
ncbi:hypothetical protein HOY82DRAFT_147784 [Tuber indicum]|nr:hypothetical protein HOY82DRAFT_147784 [Tuber indicum]